MFSGCKSNTEDAQKRTDANETRRPVYVKTFVKNELPDIGAVRGGGIDVTLEEARAILVLWSRVVAHGQGKSRHLPYVAARFINLIVAAHVPIGPGEA